MRPTSATTEGRAPRGPHRVPFVALLFACSALAGCPGRLEDPERFFDAGAQDAGALDGGAPACPPDVDVPADVFAASCDGANCHGTDRPALGLDLVSPDVWSRIADRETVNAACAPAPLVDPDAPRASGLYLKVSGTACGQRMPVGGALDAETIACIERWMQMERN